eukprot:3513013-Heterocapsa_arctica.AAC.1
MRQPKVKKALKDVAVHLKVNQSGLLVIPDEPSNKKFKKTILEGLDEGVRSKSGRRGSMRPSSSATLGATSPSRCRTCAAWSAGCSSRAMSSSPASRSSRSRGARSRTSVQP